MASSIAGLEPLGRPREANNRFVKQYLVGKGLGESIAHSLSMNELCYWTEAELDNVFKDLDVTPNSLRAGLISFHAPFAHNEVFVKPTLAEIEASVDMNGALCVNKYGQFMINPEEGFAALSHVWSQGLGSDPENRGLRKSLLDQVFAKIEPLGVEWIWTDSLAIPGGSRTLTSHEIALKVHLINAMADIYRNANHVVIIDALCLRLRSVDPVKTAIALCCGVWMTRVWTYQEVKLATNAVVVTEDGFVKFGEISDFMGVMAHLEVGEKWRVDSPGQYPSLAKSIKRLERNDRTGVSLPDLAISCGQRDAGEPLDYVRALFPTLRIQWNLNDDARSGMRKLYEAQKDHASRLTLYHGPPRAPYPSWAPAVFHGYTDCKITSEGQWLERGMRRTWLASKIKSIIPSKPPALILEFDNGQPRGALSCGFISEATKRESPQSIEAFQKAVDQGSAYLLSDEALIPKQRSSRVGLVVQRNTRSQALEAWVLFTLAVGETEESWQAQRGDWLLLHESPLLGSGIRAVVSQSAPALPPRQPSGSQEKPNECVIS